MLEKYLSAISNSVYITPHNIHISFLLMNIWVLSFKTFFFIGVASRQVCFTRDNIPGVHGDVRDSRGLGPGDASGIGEHEGAEVNRGRGGDV